jgi:Zn ribbon nucleic-acid-binding protein
MVDIIECLECGYKGVPRVVELTYKYKECPKCRAKDYNLLDVIQEVGEIEEI